MLNAWVVGCRLAVCSYLAVSQRRMAKSSKHSRSKENSLPPAKQFDFTTVDENFEELQRGFVPKETNVDTKKCVQLLKDWASARNEPRC